MKSWTFRTRIAIALCVVFAYPTYILVSSCFTWTRLALSGAPVSITSVLGQHLRNSPSSKLATCYIALTKVGLPANMDRLELHHLSGGDIDLVTKALISANRANIPIDFEFAAALDLAPQRADMSLLEALDMMVQPTVSQIPIATPGHDALQFATSGGAILDGQITITYSPNLQTLVGGADLQTLFGRVFDTTSRLVHTMGSAESAIGNVSEIGRAVLREQPDTGTAYQLLAIEIRLWLRD